MTVTACRSRESSLRCFGFLALIFAFQLATSQDIDENSEDYMGDYQLSNTDHFRQPSKRGDNGNKGSYSPWRGKRSGGGFSPWVGKRFNDEEYDDAISRMEHKRSSERLPQRERYGNRYGLENARPKKFLPWTGKRSSPIPEVLMILDHAESKRNNNGSFNWDRMRKKAEYNWDRLKRDNQYNWDRM